MRQIKPLLPLIIVLVTFYIANGQSQSATLPKLKYDTATIAIIPFDVKNFFGELDKTNTPSTLTQEDIAQIEIIFQQSVTEHDSSLKGDAKKHFSIWDQTLYKRQYVCYLNKQGEKIVYVDCFCSSMDVDWHKQMMIVDDGGRCFFNLKINLSTKKYFDFMVNGYA
jgi:hypothetical protein